MSYRVEKLVIDGHTDTHTQGTTIPEGQNWPRVKIVSANEWPIYMKVMSAN